MPCLVGGLRSPSASSGVILPTRHTDRQTRRRRNSIDRMIPLFVDNYYASAPTGRRHNNYPQGGGIKQSFCLASDVCPSVCLSHTSGLIREQRGLGKLNWHRGSPRHTRLGHQLQGQKVKGQLVADVVNSQHAGTGATWRINAKILSTCRGLRHIVSPRAQLVAMYRETGSSLAVVPVLFA